MAKRVHFTDQAKADLRAIEQATALQILKTVPRFSNPAKATIKRLQGVEPPLLRLRTQSHRVLFRDLGDAIEITRVRDRKDSYR